jgi:hypothetical protein
MGKSLYIGFHMGQRQHQLKDEAEWFFFSGGPGAPRYGDDPTKHAVDHDTEAFVREVLQNANDQGLDNGDPVEVTFRFVTLSGDEKHSFLESLGWGDALENRVRSIAHSERGRRYEEVLQRIEDPNAEIRLLIVEDRNTTGITGNWDDDSNYAALVRDELYSSKQNDTAGGSYGLGKSVLWTFSGASTVVFNSHLDHGPKADESPRLIARSKLPTHEINGDDTTYQGAGWLCRPTETEDGVRPESLWGTEAISLAEKLHVSRPEQTGTSALVVEYRDPTRDERPDIEDLANQFVKASVKYFWPAIHRGDLKVTVEIEDKIVEANVESVPAIQPFLECYTERFSEQDNLEAPGDVAGLDIPVKIPSRADGTETPDGSVRLATRLASPADDDTYLNSVALFRGAGMVVKYYDQNRVAYGDRNFHGVLATGEARSDGPVTDADKEIDRFLRFSEPPEHDEWESTENLREQYQRGFRTALDDMFGTMRDGLRHLISKKAGADTLSDSVLDRFPIHGSGSPRSTVTPPEPAFEIQSGSGFENGRWSFSGRVEVTLDEFEDWSAEISLTRVGEDGSRQEEIPVKEIEVENENVNAQFDDGTALLRADRSVQRMEFKGRSVATGESDSPRGEVGETQLEIRAELETNGGE